LLSSGKWYRVERDFVRGVNEYFGTLPRFEGGLPEYNDTCKETYNARVCQATPLNFVLMDQDLIKYGASEDFKGSGVFPVRNRFRPGLPWNQLEKKPKIPAKVKSIRGKLNVPRERFHLTSNDRYRWAGKTI
jgi:hypothetical protein